MSEGGGLAGASCNLPRRRINSFLKDVCQWLVTGRAPPGRSASFIRTTLLHGLTSTLLLSAGIPSNISIRLEKKKQTRALYTRALFLQFLVPPFNRPTCFPLSNLRYILQFRVYSSSSFFLSTNRTKMTHLSVDVISNF